MSYSYPQPQEVQAEPAIPTEPLTQVGERPYEELAMLLEHGDLLWGDQRITKEPDSTPESLIRYRHWTRWELRIKGSGTHYLEPLIRRNHFAVRYWGYIPHTPQKGEQPH